MPVRSERMWYPSALITGESCFTIWSSCSATSSRSASRRQTSQRPTVATETIALK